MTRCLVVGHAIAAVAHPSLAGFRLALCQRLGPDGSPESITPPVLAIDPLGAGVHQEVLVTTDGRGARQITGDPRSPVRHAIIALIDHQPDPTPAQPAAQPA